MQIATSDMVGAGWAGELAHALTWTLLHSVWIGASVALCLFGFLRLVHVRRARLRYAASAGALLSVPLVAVWTLLRELDADAGDIWFLVDGSTNEAGGLYAAALGTIGLLLAWADGLRGLVSPRVAPLEELLALTWGLLALLAGLRVAGGLMLLRQRSAREFVRATARSQARVARLAAQLGLRRRVGLFWSERAEVPMVVGALRPRIVIPSSLAARVEQGELDVVLLHELAHVRRGDGIARLIEAVLRALFVLHPILPWIAARVAREREHCCDDIALGVGADRLSYVRSLAALESSRSQRVCAARRAWFPRLVGSSALHATDGALLERVRRLISPATTARRGAFASACGGLFLGSAGLTLGALPTHDLRPPANLARSQPMQFERSLELEWTSASGTADDQEPVRRTHMFVIADDSGDSAMAPATLVVGDKAAFVRVTRPGGSAAGPDHVKRVIQIRALSSAR